MSFAFREGLRALANKEIDWDTDNIDVILIATGATPNIDTWEDLADISAADRYGTSDQTADLAGRSIVEVAGGIVELRATATTFTSVALDGGDDVIGIIGYLNSGTEATSTLLFYDTLVADVTPDGNNIIYTPAATGCIRMDA
jgi:hypothetical protein